MNELELIKQYENKSDQLNKEIETNNKEAMISRNCLDLIEKYMNLEIREEPVGEYIDEDFHGVKDNCFSQDLFSSLTMK